MKSLENILPTVVTQPKTTAPALPSCAPQNALALPIQRSPEGQKRMAMRLYRDFQAMKTYGKEPESLDAIIEVFNETLAGYSWQDINAAMIQHTKASAEFPTPADIVKLLDAKIERETAANRPERKIYQAPPDNSLDKAQRQAMAETLKHHRQQLSPEEKIQRTIETMRSEGAPKADVEAFAALYGIRPDGSLLHQRAILRMDRRGRSLHRRTRPPGR
jgi:hypothetical protein